MSRRQTSAALYLLAANTVAGVLLMVLSGSLWPWVAIVTANLIVIKLATIIR